MTEPSPPSRWARQLIVLLLGTGFGIVLIKAQIANWFRIQEMFHFGSFQMYGVILSAVLVASVSVRLLRATGARALGDAPIRIPDKPVDQGQLFGGLIFGAGWAITGACPGPLYAQLGALGGFAGVTLLSAVAGAWLYGALKSRLPH